MRLRISLGLGGSRWFGEVKDEIMIERRKGSDGGSDGWIDRWMERGGRVEEYVYNPMYDLTNHNPSRPSIITGRVWSLIDGPT